MDYIFASSPKVIFSMEEIYNKIWKLPDLNNVKTVRVHLARIRQKLRQACPDYSFIEIVRGKGVCFEMMQKN